MTLLFLPDLRLHAPLAGPPGGAPVVLLHGVALSHRVWRPLLPALGARRCLMPDLRGHGASDPGPPGRGTLGALVHDAERAMDHHAMAGARVVGQGLGGMVALALAAKRPDLVQALVLIGTAARLGPGSAPARHAALAEAQGMEALAPRLLPRWLGPGWATHPARAEVAALIAATPVAGFVAGCGAMGSADLTRVAEGLRQPALWLAGAQDGEVPPDLVRDDAALGAGHRFALLRQSGHLPWLDPGTACATAISDALAAPAP
jgi:3-oxoadipate enol-lactonase